MNLNSSELKPLEITCSSTNCEDDLHCFSRFMKKAEKKYGKQGVCYECGNDSIDWDRMYQNDINDSKFIFKSLSKELIREVFWKMNIDKLAIENSLKKKKSELRLETILLLNKRIGLYTDWDGQQTPLGKDNIINYAQHATATCCRKCLSTWHNIPKEQELTKVQLEFCTNLVMKFIEERIPELH